MLTLRDCFLIATLFAIPLATLRYTHLSGFFLFIPATFGVWLYIARRNAVVHPTWRVLTAAGAGALFQAFFFVLYEVLNLNPDTRLDVNLNPMGVDSAFGCYLGCAATGGACFANFCEAWKLTWPGNPPR